MMTSQDSVQNPKEQKPAALIGQIAAMESCREGRALPVQKIRSIKVIGAVTGKDGVLSPRDTAILKNTFNALTQSGFVFTPDVTLDIVNLADRRDYLREKVPADLHVFCFVYSPRLEEKLACSGRRDIEGMKEDERQSLQQAWKYSAGINEAFFHRQSDLHYEEGAWLEAATRQKAKIIATYGYNLWEIGTGDFTGGSYTAWIGTEERLQIGFTPLQLDKRAYAYGFLLKNDMAEKNAQALARAKQGLFKGFIPR